MKSAIRLTIMAALALAGAMITLPVWALEWGPDGHDGIVYETAKALGYSEDAAKVLALGSVAPDWFEFSNDAAHAQTPEHVENQWREPTQDEKKAAYEQHRAWVQKYERAAADAVSRGNSEQALFLYGYALHGIMDYATHRGMTAAQHGLLSRRDSDPDKDAKRIQEARRETAYILGKLGRSMNGGRLREFTHGSGDMDLKEYAPSGKGAANVALDIVKIAAEPLIGEKGTEKVKEGLLLYLSRTTQVTQLTPNRDKIAAYLARPDLAGQSKEIVEYKMQYVVGPIEKAGEKELQVARERIVDWPSQLGTDSPGVIIRGKTPEWGALSAPKGEPKPGGVLLSGPALALFEMDDLMGAKYDRDRKELILVGRQSKSIPFDPDLWFTALAAAYAGEAPWVSIDPGANNDWETLKVSYGGPIRNTKLGRVMFEADRLLKTLSLGKDNLTNREIADLPEKLPQPLKDDEGALALTGIESGVVSRFWFQTGKMTLDMSDDGRAILFRAAEVPLLTEVMSPKPPPREIADRNEAFVAYVNREFGTLAERWGVLEELRQGAKAVAVAEWLRGRVPFDHSWLEAGVYVPTPETTPSITLQREIVRPPFKVELRVTGGVDLAARSIYSTANSALVDQFFAQAAQARPATEDPFWLRRIVILIAVGAVIYFLRKKKWWVVCAAAAVCVFLTSHFAYWVLPTRYVSVWTFIPPQGSDTYVAVAFPAGDTALSSKLPSYGFRARPTLRASAQSGHGENWAGTIPVLFKNPCLTPETLWVNGVALGTIPPKSDEGLTLDLPPGEYKFGLTDFEETFVVSRQEHKFRVKCGGTHWHYQGQWTPPPLPVPSINPRWLQPPTPSFNPQWLKLPSER